MYAQHTSAQQTTSRNVMLPVCMLCTERSLIMGGCRAGPHYQFQSHTSYINKYTQR